MGTSMNRETFFDTIRSIADPSECIMISHAYWLAKQVHRDQVRDGGERYFEHCRRIALALTRISSATAQDIVLAFLHDCIEDGFMPPGLLRTIFGEEMACGVMVISKTIPVFDDSFLVISRRKKDITAYFAGIAQAPAFVKRVKCADRLDNLRTMDVWTSERRKKYLEETMDYVVPLARRTDEMLLQKLQEACVVYK